MSRFERLGWDRDDDGFFVALPEELPLAERRLRPPADAVRKPVATPIPGPCGPAGIAIQVAAAPDHSRRMMGVALTTEPTDGWRGLEVRS